MTQGINWGLANGGPNGGFRQSLRDGLMLGEAARRSEDRREYRAALGALATDPGNQNALTSVFQHNPGAGIALAERADEMAFNESVANQFSTMFGGQELNALAPPHNALMQQEPAPATAPQNREPDHIGNLLGKPKSQEDRAFMMMLRKDPERAMKLRGQMRDDFVGKLQAETDFFNTAVDQLSKVTNAGEWDQMLESLIPQARALGSDILEIVPRQYPGEDVIRGLMERAQPIKDRLSHLLREANINADNARADRNVDSQIETRERRAGEYERHNRASEANTRRGQDIRDKTRRRGQNMTDARVRSGPSYRSTSKPQLGPVDKADIPLVRTPAEARALGLKKGEMVRTPDGQVFEVE
ncbi:MAG: hypothetical protein AAGI28_03505 [Pseudomonadota bacterium]